MPYVLRYLVEGKREGGNHSNAASANELVATKTDREGEEAHVQFQGILEALTYDD